MKKHAPDFFISAAKSAVPLYLVDAEDLKGKAHKALRDRLGVMGFDGGAGQVAVLIDAKATVEAVYAGVAFPLHAYSLASVLAGLAARVSGDVLRSLTLVIDRPLDTDDATQACVGYALGGYQFTVYKPKAHKTWPKLVWPKTADQKSATAMIDAIFMLRDLINTPPNDLGTTELVAAIRDVAKKHEAKVTVISGDALLKHNYPLIHAVGRASVNPPALVDMVWGNPKHPRVTLVGKGVVFDTGGLDIKPSQSMILQKKDMAGAAHMMALAHLVMSAKLPVRLRVLIPTVENSVAGNSFRPKDVIKSRKGLTVEIGNTDAEGRLILADALTTACAETPDLLIDMATLTGAAHVAVGHHLASLFARRDDTASMLMALAQDLEDPMWRMPLQESYRKALTSQIADINSTGDSVPAGSITAALFLDHFVDAGIDWLHFDFCAWEYSGRPGRPVGGTDFAIRSLFALISARYGK